MKNKKEKPTPITTNAWGEEFHPTDSYNFWKNSKKERDELRQLWDDIAASGADMKKVEKLIEICRENAALDEAYNRAESENY